MKSRNFPNVDIVMTNGNYRYIKLADGTKYRRTIDDSATKWMPEYPECIDMNISNRCSQGCSFCYANATKDGAVADFKKWKFLNDMPPMELAINGNDMDDPNLIDFIDLMRSQGVIVNMTVNQNQFMKNYDYIKDLVLSDKIRGIGISYIRYDKEFIKKASEFRDVVIHVINGLITVPELEKLNNLKILILGYKYVGRGRNKFDTNYNEIIRNQMELNEMIPSYMRECPFKCLSFDGLALDQLPRVKESVPKENFDLYFQGREGEFTFYIDLVSGKYGINSIIGAGWEIGDKSIKEMFHVIRRQCGYEE